MMDKIKKVILKVNKSIFKVASFITKFIIKK